MTAAVPPSTGAGAGSGSRRTGFGARLAATMDHVGPLCLGIDPHPRLLAAWDLPDTPAGLERFSLTALAAATGQGGGAGADDDGGALAAAVKPQVALYERHGSAGLAVLERLLAAAREAGMLTIADAKRGDIGSTMAGYAEAWLADGSPLAADALTLSPFLGYGSLAPALEMARATGRGVFVLALTSNPEGAEVQHAGAPREAVARRVTEAATADNATALAETEAAADIVNSTATATATAIAGAAGVPSPWSVQSAGPGARPPLGPVGLVVGATVAAAAADLGLDLAGVRGALLAPGFGAQGATGAQMRQGFGAAWPSVLATSSRAILRYGPSVSALRAALAEARQQL